MITSKKFYLYTANGRDDRLELISGELRKKIFVAVLTAHFVLLLVPFLWYIIGSWLFSKKAPAIKVQLIDLIPENTSFQEAPQPENISIPEPQPVDIPDIPDKPEIIVPKPDPKPKWKARTASEITISKNVVTSRKKPVPTVSASDIAAKLKRIQQQCRIISPAGASSGIASRTTVEYYDRVSAYLYQLWKQPNKSELQGKYPVVSVSMKFDKNGSIRSSRILKYSGNAVMDKSVAELLAGISSLPAPPQEITELDISLEIVEE